MTNMGIVLPEPGYHVALRALTRATGTLLVIDETHTFSAGPGGCTRAWDLEPDLLTIGKAIGSGVPAGALGLSAAVTEAMFAQADADYEDTGGVGGTLAGKALSLAAVRVTLERVLTEEAFARTIPLGQRFCAGLRGGDRSARPALAQHSARVPRGVSVHAAACSQRRRGARRVGRPA